MKKSLFLISSALLLIAGCAKEQLVETSVQNGYDGPVTIVGAAYEQFAADGETKASFGENGQFGWITNEPAAFEVKGSPSWYSANASDISDDKSKCSFQIVGDLSADTVAVLPADINPARYDEQSTNDGLKVTLPASRTWVKDQSYATMLGFGSKSGNNINYSFSHLGGLAKIKVNGVPSTARKFVFKTKGYKINGEFKAGKLDKSSKQTINTIAASNEATATDDFTEDEETYSLTFTSEDITTNDGIMEFNVPLPCGTYTNGFAFCFKDESEAVIYSFAGSTSKAVGRTDRIILPTINIVGGGGEGSPTKSVQNIPANYSGDFLLAEAENVLLKIDATGETHDITLKYNGGNVPTNLEIQVEGDKDFNANLLGTLPYTHVDFTKGKIKETQLTTSSSTFAVTYPATVGTLVVKGGNVVLKGATVDKIAVDANAVADGETKAPVQIVMEKDKQENVPAVTNGIEAAANVIVAPKDEGIEVKVKPENNAKVATEGAGTVKGENDQPITTKAAAKIGYAHYITLADAIAAVKDEQTIELLGHVTDAKGITVDEGKNFTVNFGGYTYTCASDPAGSTGTKNQVFQLLQNSTITFKDGTINVDKSVKEQFRFIIQNYANLTLMNMTLDGTNLAVNTGKVNYTISNNNGTVVFAGKTNIKAAELNGIAFDVYDKKEYSGVPTVTVNTTGTIEGQVEVTGGTLFVMAGTFITKGARRTTTANHQSPTLLVKSGTVTVKEGSFTSEHDVAVRAEGGSVTLNNGTFTGVEGAVCFPGTGATINIFDGTYTASDNAVLIGQGSNRTGDANTVTISGGTFNGGITSSGYIACGIYSAWKDNITVKGGDFTITGGAGVVARAGVVSIEGGVFNCTGTATGKVGDKATALPCECLIFDNSDPAYPGKTNDSKIIVKKGTFSDLSGVKYVDDSGTYTLANDVALATPLEIESGKTFIIDLGTKTLTGRTNIKHGNVTFKNGKINGGSQQALNVYGSESSAENYSVVTINNDVTVEAEVFGVCLFGPINTANVGYGAGIDIKGTVTTTKTSSSNEGAIFVSGNLGNNQNTETQTAMEGKNFVNISGTVTSQSDAALALNGSATATITGNLTGNTGIAAKRGKLIVKDNATITGNGACVNAPSSNNSGTELTGSAVSASSTYGQHLSIELQEGTYTSKAYTILNNANDSACQFNISGGSYTTTKENDGIVVYARLGSVNITGGEFTNKSNTEATLHVGCPSVGSLQPKLTISGEKTTVKNTASEAYPYQTGWKALTVNMANELTYKAVEISGGTFHGQSPEKDDSWTSENDTHKYFLATDCQATETTSGSNVWKVSAKSQQE